MGKKEAYIQDQLRKELLPVSSDTMADIVEARLHEYIRKKSIKAGDVLPNEAQFAEALGVSRNVIREALGRLRMLGLVEPRKKRGTILTNPDIPALFEKVLDPHIMAKDTLEDLFELRLVLEMGMADILFINLSSEYLAQLDAIVAAERKSRKHVFQIQNEIAFHGKLYEIAGNETLKRFQIMLLPIFGYVLDIQKDFVSGRVTHADLVELLKKGNKEDFRNGMYQHLKPRFDKLIEQKKGNIRQPGKRRNRVK